MNDLDRVLLILHTRIRLILEEMEVEIHRDLKEPSDRYTRLNHTWTELREIRSQVKDLAK